MRRLLEEVEREEGEHGTTFGLLFVWRSVDYKNDRAKEAQGQRQ